MGDVACQRAFPLTLTLSNKGKENLFGLPQARKARQMRFGMDNLLPHLRIQPLVHDLPILDGALAHQALIFVTRFFQYPR